MKKIIIIEDDEAIAEVTSLALEMSGHEVISIDDPDALFNMIDQFKPEVILMDYNIGNANGRKICEDIKFNPKYESLKVLLFSAAVSSESDFKNPLFRFFDGFVPKPYDLEDLLAKINGTYSVDS